ncbi:MAG: InlB B-repeat-containing protein, partial [Clostridia bacterium]|nr:InlB B-repeat-containing protein [Clostridia bacterium]
MKKRAVSLIALLLVLTTLIGYLPSCAPASNTGGLDVTSDVIDQPTDEPSGGNSNPSNAPAGPGESGGETNHVPEDDGVVSIELLDCGGAYIDTVLLEEGEAFARPEPPSKPNATFVDWYADEAGTIPFDFSSPILVNTVIYGKWIEEPLYEISGLSFDIESNTVTVFADVDAPCRAVVRLIDETVYYSDGYVQGTQYLDLPETVISVTPGKIADETESGTLLFTASLACDLPQYFVAEAILISENDSALCDPIVSITHTSRYEQFESTTIHDFAEDDTVLTFGEEENNNFGVLTDDVKILTAERIVEETAEDGISPIYRVTAPSETIHVGDKIFISLPNGENGMLCLVNQVTEENGTVSVTPNVVNQENASALTDFYKFLKVDTGDKTKSLNFPALSINLINFSVSGETKGSLTVRLCMVYAPNLFGESYCSIDLTLKNEVTNTLSFTVVAKKEHEHSLNKYEDTKEISVPEFIVPTGVYGLNVFAGVKFLVEFGVAGSVVTETKAESTTRFTYDTRTGYTKTVEPKTITSTVTHCEGEFYVKVGVQPYIGLGFFGHVVDLRLDVLIGAAIRGKTTGLLHGEDEQDHRCLRCIDGGVYSVVEFELSLNVNLLTKKNKDGANDDGGINLGKLAISAAPKLLNKKLLSFYFSIISEGDFPKSGIGECPNRLPLVPISIYPYPEHYYPAYDPESGLPYPGVSAPSTAFQYPWDLEVVNA